MTNKADAKERVREFILETAKTLALAPLEGIAWAERAYLCSFIATAEGAVANGSKALPKLSETEGKLLVYELQEHLHVNYDEDEAEALYNDFVEEDYRTLYVAVDRPEGD